MEDARVVAADRGEQKVEDLLVRRREVDVAPPDPARLRLGEVVDQANRLRIVDDHEVVVVREVARVQLLVASEDLLVRVAQAMRVALDRVVNRLRDVEEVLGSANDPPLDLEAGVLHQRHERVVDLCDTAAERGCREVHDPLPCERRGELAYLLHQPARGERRVIRERLVSDVDELQQADGQAVRTLTKRSLEPRPWGPRPSANSSAIARMIAMPRPPSVSVSRSPGSPSSAGSKPPPSSFTSIASRSPYSSYEISTEPPASEYAWRTEFEVASVSASLRSASSSSEIGRRRASPVSASRQSAMYSGRAGIVSRTIRPSWPFNSGMVWAVSRTVIRRCRIYPHILAGKPTRIFSLLPGACLRRRLDPAPVAKHVTRDTYSFVYRARASAFSRGNGGVSSGAGGRRSVKLVQPS